MAASPPLLACVELPMRRYSTRDALDHDVLVTVSSFLDTSLQLTLSQAAMKGHRYLMERMAHRQPFDELDSFFRQWIYTKAMACAAERGDLGFIQWLTTSFPGCFVTAAVEAAAKSGHLSILQWLHAHHHDVKWGADEMTHALRNNHVELCHWLYENVPESLDCEMVVAAAESGNLELVKWAAGGSASGLPELKNVTDAALGSGNLELIEWVMSMHVFHLGDIPLDRAAEFGHLGAIKWMVDHGMAHCTPSALKEAADAGHFEMVKWIVANRPENWITQPVDCLCSFGNVEIVQWLSENLPDCFTDEAMDSAAMNGHLGVVKYLHENRTEGCTVAAMDYAASGGYLDVVKFLHENRSEGCTTTAMDDAAAHGFLDVVQWLHTYRDEGCTYRAMARAAERGHLHVVKWLCENLPEMCEPYGIDYAAKNGHLETLKWLQTHFHMESENYPSRYALDETIGHGHLDVFRYLLATQPLSCSSDAFGIAVQNGQFEVLLMLRNEFGLKPQMGAFMLVMLNNELEMLQWLVHSFPDLPRTVLYQTELAQGVHVRNWLRDNGYFNPPRGSNA